MTGTDQGPAFVAATAGGRRGRRWPLLSLVVCVTALTGVVLSAGLGRDPSVADSVLLHEPAPPLAGQTLEGGYFDLDNHRGNIVLVNVWASWCAPCRHEYALLEAAATELSHLGVQVVGINTRDTPDAAALFLDEMGGPVFPNVLDPEGWLAIDWGTLGVPETFLVDRDGRLRAKRAGQLSAEWITTVVLPLIERR